MSSRSLCRSPAGDVWSPSVNGEVMWYLWIQLLACTLAAAEMVTLKDIPTGSLDSSSLKFSDSTSSQLNVECHVGSLCSIQNSGLAKLDKVSSIAMSKRLKVSINGFPFELETELE